MNLTTKTCVPCRGGVPPLTTDAAERYLDEAPGWQLLESATRIERRLRFGNFAETLAFVNRVGELAEAEGHHPDISFGWGVLLGRLLYAQNQRLARERLHHGREGQRTGLA